MRYLNEERLDGVILDDSEALHYFTGFDISLTSYRALIVTSSGDVVFVLRKLDVAPLVERTWIKDFVAYSDWQNPSDAIAETIHAKGMSGGRIGISLKSHALTVDRFNEIRARTPGAEFVDIGDRPFMWRKVKTSAEIEKLRLASEAVDRVMQIVIDKAKPGMTERDAARVAAEGLLRYGCDSGFLGIITAGDGWDFLHGHLHDRPLLDGDILHLELTPRVDGYSARLMRCIVMGEISEQRQRVTDKLIELQDAQIQALKPGAKASEVDAIVRNGLLASGFRKSYDNVTGYTTGWYSDYSIRGSDFTWTFHPEADWQVEEGMVFHMYTSAQGIAISETVLATANGGERLTKIDRKLFNAVA